MSALGIGSTVWVQRQPYGSRAKEWEPVKIIGETRVSWIIGHPHSPEKLPKKGKNILDSSARVTLC